MPENGDPYPIYFYGQTEPFAEFSNFAPYGIAVDAQWWPSVEHYYQAMKFTDCDLQRRIRLSNTPKQAKAKGITRDVSMRADWEHVKRAVMQLAVRIKFATHAHCRELLLSTDDAEIVESSPMDYYWGCGADGSGQNVLGQILMQVRDELRAAY